MSGAFIGVYKFSIMVKGHQVYKTVWTPLNDETLIVHDVERYKWTQ